MQIDETTAATQLDTTTGPGPAPARFAVFLSHNSRDKPTVERIALKLQRVGLEPWLDKWCLTPGGRWQEELAAGLHASSACAIFIGPHGMGDWVREELGIALDRAAKDRAFRLFLVLLPGLTEPFDATTLPPFLSTRTWVDLRPGIEDPRAFQALVNAIKGVPAGGGVAGPEAAGREAGVCPYRGLQTFDPEHADLFFGRDNDIQRLVEKLKATHFLAVLGPSGSGKSSLVRAGLIPALRKGALPDSASWTTCVFTPGAHPLTTLAAQLVRLYAQETMHRTLDGLQTDPRTLHLATALAMADQPPGQRTVVVVDQFEEVFTLCHDEPERAAFLSNLLYASAVPDGRCLVVLTLRADFYPKCAAYPDLSARIAAQQFLVSPMSLDGLRQAIEEPAYRVGLEFEEGLVATILDDVAHQPGALPLLEHALLELWERRRGRMLTLEAYRASGGVQGAIAKRADAIYSRFTPQEQVIARRTLLRLTQPGEGTEDTRRRAALDELVTRATTGVAVEDVVRTLVDARLLTTSEDEPAHRQVVEVAHEALIRGWPQLRAWIEEDRAGLRVQRQLTEAALEWERLGRDEGILYRGARLAAAVEWADHNDAALNSLERAFLDASVALKTQEEEEERERQQRELAAAQKLAATERERAEAARALAQSERRRLRVARAFTIGLAVVLVGAVVAAVVAVQQSAVAQQQTRVAQQQTRMAEQQRRVAQQQRDAARAARQVAFSRELAANALTQLQSDPELSVLLATRAVQAARTTEAVDSLRQALSDSYVRAVMYGHTGAVNSAAFSPNGRYVVTASADHTARVWQARTGRLVAVLRGHTGAVNGAAFSPDSRYVVTASSDHTARIWQVGDTRVGGRLIAVLRGHTAAVTGAAFSPNGRYVVTASNDHTARIWQASTGRLVAVLRGHSGPISSAAFSPDSRYVVTASADDTARLWQARSGRLVHVLRGHTAAVNSAAFSPTGRYVITASADGTARIWDARSGHAIATLTSYFDNTGMIDAQFSADGAHVLTVSALGAQVWLTWKTSHADCYAPACYDLLANGNSITSATFSPDGTLVATTHVDGTVRIWQPKSELIATLYGHSGVVDGAAFSPDSASVVTAGSDGTARVWAVGPGRVVATLRPTPGAPTPFIFHVAYSPDGRYVVTANVDGTARVWAARTGRLIAVLRGHTKAVINAAFSPNGKWLVTTSADRTARVWSVGTWRTVAILRGHTHAVDGVAFSPNGKWLVTTSADHTARVWQVGRWRTVTVLRGHSGVVYSAAYSPDGRWIVTGSFDRTARVWAAHTGRLVAVLRGHTDSVSGVAFSPDGRYVATASFDGSARVWDTRTWRSVATLSGHTDRVFGVAFSPDGRFLVTASADYTARVWEVGTWRTLTVLYGHTSLVLSAAFSPNDLQVVTSGADGTVRLYTCDGCGTVDHLLALARTRVTRQLTPQERATYLHLSQGA